MAGGSAFLNPLIDLITTFQIRSSTFASWFRIKVKILSSSRLLSLFFGVGKSNSSAR